MQYKRVIASLGVVLIDTAFAFYGILAIAICSCGQKNFAAQVAHFCCSNSL